MTGASAIPRAWAESATAGEFVRGGDVTGASFPDADLTGVRLKNTTAVDASFASALLEDARFDGGNFARASFEGAFLVHTQFFDCTLSGAKFDAAQMRGSSLATCVARSVSMVGTDLTRADLSGALLGGSNLTNAVLRDAKAEGVSLVGADLTGADLRGADLTNANLVGARMEGVRWEGAKLDGAFFDAGAHPEEHGGHSRAPLRRRWYESNPIPSQTSLPDCGVRPVRPRGGWARVDTRIPGARHLLYGVTIEFGPRVNVKRGKEKPEFLPPSDGVLREWAAFQRHIERDRWRLYYASLAQEKAGALMKEGETIRARYGR